MMRSGWILNFMKGKSEVARGAERVEYARGGSLKFKEPKK